MSVKLAKSAGLVGAATLGSRLLGLARNKAIAYFFGAGLETDAFNVATRIPTLLRELFAEGAMSAAFVPTFARTLKRDGKPAAWLLGSNVLNAVLAITTILVLAGMVFTTPLVGQYAAKYAEVPGKLELTIQLTRFTLPFLTLVSLAAVFMGMLNALGRFFLPAFSPAMMNVALIVSAAVSGPVGRALGVAPIYVLASGFVVGGLAQMLFQWPALRREGFRHTWSLDFSQPGLREVLILMGPGTIGQAAAQINVLINTSIATSQGQGAVTWLNNAFQLMYMPIGIFGVSVATAAIPDIARFAADHSFAEMRKTLSYGMRLMLALSVPACVGLMVLGGPISELTLEGGRFTSFDSRMVAAALMFYAPGLVGYSLVKLLSPSFYALRDPRTPVIVSVIAVATNLVLNLLFVRSYGFRGLALGTGIAANVNAGLLLYLLSRRVEGGIDGRRVFVTFVKVLIASVAMGAAAYFAERAIHALLPAGTLLFRAIRVGGGIGIGLVVLAVVAHLMHIEEFRQASDRILKRVRG